jgi:acetyltransferase-like isoleucine patch superfamily enzyme
LSAITFRQWVKRRDNALADNLWRLAKAARGFSMPVVPGLHRALYASYVGGRGLCAEAARVLWWTPLFQSRLSSPAPGLHLYGGLPLVLGPLRMSLGPDCRVSAQTTFSGRTASAATPELVIGRNCDIGWQTTIAVGRRIVLGDNVRIAGRAFLAGYPGHPLDARARAAGLPDEEAQVGDIVLEDDVWLATGVTVSAGVTIGRGAVVAAGSVVTRDLPPFVLAAGASAKVIRSLGE